MHTLHIWGILILDILLCTQGVSKVNSCLFTHSIHKKYNTLLDHSITICKTQLGKEGNISWQKM